MKKVLLHSLRSLWHDLFNEASSKLQMKNSFKSLKAISLSLFIVLVSFTNAQAESINQYVTLNETNSSLEKVIFEIRSQTGYDFIYNARLLKESNPQ